jgi:hypothetical protein
MNRDTSGGAVHGLGKRGTGVGIADHGRAGDSRQDDPATAGTGSPREGYNKPVFPSFLLPCSFAYDVFFISSACSGVWFSIELHNSLNENMV